LGNDLFSSFNTQSNAAIGAQGHVPSDSEVCGVGEGGCVNAGINAATYGVAA
jgi:hypothetical protein